MSSSVENIFAQAIAAFQTGKLNDAELHFKEVLRRQPAHVGALNLLGVLLTRLEKYSEAERYMKSAIEVSPASDATFYNYGLILKSLNRPAEAFERFSQAIAINGAIAETWNNRGTVLNDLKRFDDAILDFNRSLELQPNNPQTYCNKGNALAALKRHDEALATYDKALALKPGLVEARNGRNRVIKSLNGQADVSTDAVLKRALQLLQENKLDGAEQSLNDILQRQPDCFAALDLLVVVLMRLGRHAEAERHVISALGVNPRADTTLNNYGLILKTLNRRNEALERFSEALAVNPANALTWNNRGTVLNDLARYDDAIADFDKALALDAEFLHAYCSKGNSLSRLGRHDAAFAAYDRALSIKPDLADAWVGRGNVLLDLKRHHEAFAAFDKCLALQPSFAEAWAGRGNALYDLNRHAEALAAYDKALALRPDLADAWVGRGNGLAELKRYDDAFAAYDKALALKQDMADAWNGRGNVLGNLKRYDEAVNAYDRALEFNPGLVEAWFGRGNALFSRKRYGEAFAAYDKTFTLNPRLISLEGLRLHAKLHSCDWNNYDSECSRLVESVRNQNVSSQPFEFLAIPSSPSDQQTCAKLWVASKFPPSGEPIWRGERYHHDRIRVAYLSADFHQHPTSYLMAEMFERHDKSRFEITAISCGSDDGSAMRKRLKTAFERFIDARSQGDDEIAAQITALEIDILVDLKGFTDESRTAVLSRKPAPIQVNYLGYPGTMGTPYIDYIIADRTLIPDEEVEFYSEKVAFMPNSYQVNDAKRAISDRAFTRLELGLPPAGFVFCCFNNNYKISPHIFDCWMQILKQVDASVLWLLESNPVAASNLRQQAAAAGVNAERLIFAKSMPLSEHLARHRAADLFLDTLPYNAHTTASDALWAGLPLLTCLGDTFAGRVAASLLTAIDLPELIATSPDAYERMAVDYARHPEKLAVIKRKLDANRLTAPLFDAGLFTKHLEAAYVAMHERHLADLAPDHIVVQD